mgnify:CR=1 FL=1|jgi:REP element-mobilizing transposase RayT
MSRKYKFRNDEGVYFVSTTVWAWIDVFTRIEYKDILTNSLSFCQDEKGLKIHAYVLMTNHFHILISKKDQTVSLSDIIRDLKKYTAMQIIKAIKNNPKESRKEWMLELFSQAGKASSQNKVYQFWQQNNHPLEISENQKLENVLQYIHNNPVKAGWVNEPDEYLYSSARNYLGKENRLKIHSIYDGTII